MASLVCRLLFVISLSLAAIAPSDAVHAPSVNSNVLVYGGCGVAGGADGELELRLTKAGRKPLVRRRPRRQFESARLEISRALESPSAAFCLRVLITNRF